MRLRGNANGRNGLPWAKEFFCDGCKKEHGEKVFRTRLVDGRMMCERQYWKTKKLMEMNNEI